MAEITTKQPSADTGKPPMPRWSLFVPIALSGLLAIRLMRVFPSIDSEITPLILASLIVVIGIAIAFSVWTVHRYTLSHRAMRKEIANERWRNEEMERVVAAAKQSESHTEALYHNAVAEANEDREKLREKTWSLEQTVSIQKRTEEALRRSEDRWRLLVESHPEGIIVSRGTKVVYANDVGATILGADTPNEVIGLDLLKLVPPPLHELVAGRLAAVESGMAIDPLEHRLLRADNAPLYVETFSVPITYRDEPAVQTVMRDVTDTREAERALRKYAERLAVLNHIEKCILVENSPTEIADYALRHLAGLIPLDRSSVISIESYRGEAEILAVFSTYDDTKLGPGVRRPLQHFSVEEPAEGVSYRYVADLEKVDDRSKTEDQVLAEGIRSLFSIPLVVKGEALGLLSVGSKETNAFEQEHFQMAEDVADLIAVSLRQYHTEQERLNYESELLAAKERAEEMVRLKTAFLTNMSHEIRTPLTGIIGFAQILSEEIDEEQSEFVELIEQSGRRLLETINSVLDLARLESNRMSLNAERLNIADEVRRTAQLLSPLADKKGLALVVDCDEAELYSELDPAGFDRIMNNLVGNAIKFTDKGEVRVTASADGGNIVVAVKDTGIGISEEFIPKLFEEFRQESTGPNRLHEGSGMGLSITRKLVDIMGGKISVESKKGVGTTFTISFPAMTSTAPRHEPDRPTLPRAANEREAVLVLEDREDARFLLQYVLHTKYDVHLAADLAVANEIATRERISIILADIHLGGNEGILATLSGLRAQKALRDLPVVGMTAYSWPGDRDKLLDSGFADFISRPFDRELALDILGRITDPRQKMVSL